MANGLANRFLWHVVRRTKYLPLGSSYEPNPEHITRLQRALAFARSLSTMPLSNEAISLWESLYPKLENLPPGLAGELLARGSPIVRRLACIYAILDLEAIVGRCHLVAARALWQHCEDSVAYLFGDRIGDPDADAILEYLRTHPGGTDREDIRNQIFQRHRPSELISSALSLLQQLGLAYCRRDRTAGRTRQVWFAQDLAAP
jgi:hypothetical protein